jgi:hypothetical protein
MLRAGLWSIVCRDLSGAMELEPAWEAADGDFLPG